MSYVANSIHSLSLGGLVFVANGQTVVYTDATSGETYSFNVLDPETHWGNPQPITVTLLSLMTSGSRVIKLRDENREPSIALTIKASGGAGLAAAEKALVAVVGKPAELKWQPPSPTAALTVFDVVWSRLDHKMDSVGSIGERFLRRSYAIALQALPGARGATKIITPAVATATPTVIDSAASTTNWAVLSPAGATLSVVSGAVRSTYNPATSIGAGLYGSALRRTAAVSTSTEKYISIDWKTSIPSIVGAQTNATTGNLPEVRREPGAVAGFTRSWYQVPDSVTSLAWIQFGIVHPASTGSATLEIDLVQTAATLPISGTARQLSRTINPGGSLPTEGTILVQHPTTALGTTVVFSHPVMGGYSPPLRQWRVASSAVTADSTRVSGAYNLLDTVSQFSIPNTAIPEGGCQLWVRAASGFVGSTTMFWSVYAALPGGIIGGVLLQGSTTITFPAIAPTNYLFPIASFPLPVARAGVAGRTLVEIQAGDNSTKLVYFDEAYLFATERGRLTVVDCGSAAPSPGGSANRLKIAAPSLDEPNGSIMIGTAADWSDAFTPATSAILCDQTGHLFDPDGSVTFTVTPNVTDASVSFEHYRRSHTHAES
ncbi:hypothetical protein GON03_19005 [Nocardioides sp. MAH-18]|uniref:Uncharacterized protein n=1 Tax=Nocardioides agri TaxID=2682843 RepID=A0A6L6Y138_9ACTN|nr:MULTISPECIES: hypothetical protein [unclassified Nocardioides]MBA2952106.1 hypothetical protein [Nocardioides sp. CGMCC 1.13656]MVQ51275.1 hypothetical protein [Nocardioides sp. MAH-18]